MRRLTALLLGAVLAFFVSTTAFAQSTPSGALDFGLNFHYSGHEKSVLGIHARAMAVDRVPGTMVGRFGELYGSLGVGLQGDLAQYSIGLKLGVGLGVEHFVAFIATGLMCDSYTSISTESEEDDVPPGLGIPIVLGIWIDPMPGLYFYLMAEPSWSLFADGETKVDKNPRKTEPFLPFTFAWELRLRGGVGFDVSSVHVRLDYTFHQVSQYSWHVFSLGFGFSSKDMSNLSNKALGENKQ